MGGDVEDEDFLEPGGRFHLHQPPTATGQALQHVGPDQHALVLEGRLEEHRRGVRLDDPSCLLECFRDVQVVVRDEVSARETLAGDLPHFVAGVEDGLETVVNRRRQLACVGVVPEPPVTLHPGDVARLRETMRVHGAIQCSAPACTINGRKHPLKPSRNHLLTPEASLPSRPGTQQIQPSAASTASTFSSVSAVSTIASVTTVSFAFET